MTREMIPLQDAIGRLADMHEADRDRLEAWTEEVGPKIAVALDVPLDRLRPVLEAHLAHHLCILGEMTYSDTFELLTIVQPAIDPYSD